MLRNDYKASGDKQSGLKKEATAKLQIHGGLDQDESNGGGQMSLDLRYTYKVELIIGYTVY